MVKKVTVDFRSNDPAAISDLKIYYYNMTTENPYIPTLPVIGNFEEKQLWIKERVSLLKLSNPVNIC